MWDLKSLAQTLKRTRQYFYYRKYSLFINNYKHQNSLICYSGINSGYIQQEKLIQSNLDYPDFSIIQTFSLVLFFHEY